MNEVPDGYFTIDEMAEKLEIPLTRAYVVGARVLDRKGIILGDRATVVYWENDFIKEFKRRGNA